MNFRQSLKTHSLILWVILLSIALLCAQGVGLHVHSFSHDNVQQQSLSPLFTNNHSHQSGIHLTIDTSHSDHHNQVISESAASPQALLKKVSSHSFIHTVFIITFTILCHFFYVFVFHRRRYDDVLTTTRRYTLSPPL